MRVFISSTVYDLLDVRAELEDALVEIGVSPVMSDASLSEFDATIDANSIETCLINVRQSDLVVVILDQRYGPSLGNYGFDDVSATHLEYREAKKQGITVWFYVRDRLEADYNIANRNNDQDLRLSWVRDKELLNFLEEHRKLSSSGGSNWVTLFTSSADLKKSIQHRLDPVIKPRVLMEAMQQNRFPMLSSSINIKQLGTDRLQCQVKLSNIATVPAFDVRSRWEFECDNEEHEAVLAPGDVFSMNIIINHSIDESHSFTVCYRSMIGVEVCEEYEVFIDPLPAGARWAGIRSKGQTFRHAPIPELVIEDVPD